MQGGASGISGTNGISGTGFFTDAPTCLIKNTSTSLIDTVAFLTVSGTTLTIAGKLVETSTEESKIDVSPLIPPHLEKILKLSPVYFRYKNDPRSELMIGLIAEQVEKIYPEFVSYDHNGKLSGVNYTKLTAVLIQGLKETVDIINKQQSQIDIINQKLGL